MMFFKQQQRKTGLYLCIVIENVLNFRTNDVLRDPITGTHIPEIVHDPPLLFNLKQDRGEQINIANNEPQILKRMIDEFHEAVKEITAQ